MIEQVADDVGSLRRWTAQKRREVRRYGATGAAVACKELVCRGSLRVAGKYVSNYGTPVFDHDWDLLVVLDSCRADLMQRVAPEYDFLPDEVPTTYSVGSYTAEWMDKNFGADRRPEMAETVHVTGNPHSETRLNAEDWHYLGEVWSGHQDSIGAIPPGPVTDYAIDAAERYDERLLVHYMQPHQPFRSLADPDELRNVPTKDVWRLLQFGEYTREEVLDAYADNLRWVLDHLETLLANVDRDRVLVTSDHGNGLGEYGVYGHARYVPLAPLKEVPLISVEDPPRPSEDYAPAHRLPVGDAPAGAKDRLEALGYVS